METLYAKNDFIAIDFNPFDDQLIISKIVSVNKAQQEIYLSCLFGGKEASLAYNESLSLIMTGNFNTGHFKNAFAQIIKRHEALRSAISGDGEKLIIYEDVPYTIIEEDWLHLDEESTKAGITDFITHQMSLPFDLQQAPLFRAFIHRMAPDRHRVTLIFHHIICDGWSTGIILEELSKIYSALCRGNYSLLPEAFQLSQFALVQEEFLRSQSFQQTEQFWLNQFQHHVPEMSLQADFPRGLSRTYQSRRIDQLLHHEVVESLRKSGAKIGCSLVTTMLSLFEILIYKKTQQPELVIGLPSAEQAVTEFYNLVGHCVNILPIKSSIDPERSLADYLKAKREQLMDVYEHQQYSFGQLLGSLKTKRDQSRIPLVPVVFNIDMGMDSDVSFLGLQHQVISNVRQSETFELFVNATDSTEGLTLEWNYNSQLFTPESIHKMMDDFAQLINGFIENPSVRIIDAISIGQNQAIINGVTAPVSKTFIELLRETVCAFPGKIALIDNENQISYLSLEKQTNALANYLSGRGVKKGQVVALAMHRSAQMITGIIGILKTGAAYLPIDPTLPADRVRYMLEDGDVELMITDVLENVPAQVKSVNLTQVFQFLDQESAPLPKPEISLTDTAYLLYTSGSTGRPKGVKISHKNLSNLLSSTRLMPGMIPDDKLLAITTISFDIAMLELFLPLISGASVIVASTEAAKDGRLINELILRENITTIQGTPSTLSMILDSGLQQNKLHIIVGGEQLDLVLANKIIATGARLWNMYGPTETTIYSIGKEILKEDEVITIGRPLQNTQVYINNPAGYPVQIGQTGEICIAGEGVGLGYLNNNALTSQKFSLAAKNSNTILYKTGDLGKILPNGEVQCFGRIDQQIKIRGHRIEPVEIETVLLSQTGISQALVMQRNDHGDDSCLVAYITLHDAAVTSPLIVDHHLTHGKQLTLAKSYSTTLSECLAATLPAYMTPQYIIALNSFPLTPNGKVDRSLLPAPKRAKELILSAQSNVLNHNEQTLLNIWSECLGTNNITLTDDFFELGGNSLMAVRLMVKIEKETGIQLPLTTLLSHSTIEKLALQMKSGWSEQRSQTLIPIRTNGSRPPVYLIHGSGLNVLLFKGIMQSLDADQPVYGIQAIGLDQFETIPDSIEAIASRYIEELLSHNPDGPYHLVGYSMGGFIAFEMAKQLKKAGKEISMLGVVDTDTGENTSLPGEQKKMSYFIKRQFKKIPFIAKSFHKTPVKTIRYQLNITKQRLLKNQNEMDMEFGLLSQREKEIYTVYDLALEKYVLSPAALKVTLFRVSERLYFLDDLIHLGWDRFATLGVEVCEIPGDHKTFISETHRSDFARILQNQINQHTHAY
ncbi:amino acid adenylation domain-containing protein [Pedobacter frigidisoli]|uniref:non-ribosomal peptide synthetase n=1 Tax=Pedobacter frigidisoli TaxID=2530455 RepID=UPI0029306D08|nr:amino acid adenylation domain-containing protein [Pedobacter frigidisoli]